MSVIEARLKTARIEFAVARMKNLAYIMGGLYNSPSNVEGWYLTSSVEIFDMELEKVKKGKSIRYEEHGFTANIV